MLGFALPLVIGVATGHVAEGVAMAGGAIGIGSVGLNATSSARVRAMLLACVGVAVSAFVGSATSRIDWLAILVAGIWGVGVGMLVPLGKYATPIGLQAAAALIVLSHFSLDPLHAALQAFLIFAGALLQTGLIWLVSRGYVTTIERITLAQAYEILAEHVHGSVEGVRPVGEALLNAYEMLAESSMPERPWKVFHALLEEAERIRLLEIAIFQLRLNIEHQLGKDAKYIYELDQVLEAAATELRLIAYDLKPSSPFVRPVQSPYIQFKLALHTIRNLEKPPESEQTLQQLISYCDKLRSTLHHAKKLARSWSYKQLRHVTSIPGGSRATQQSHLQWHNAFTTLRANLSLQSAAFRHAIRLGIALALSTAFYRLGPLPIERGYWIPLTALVVLRPDFTNTFARGLARTLGTFLGVGLTTILVGLLMPTHWWLVILDAVMAYLAFAFLFANYALFSVFMTSSIVFLLTLVIPNPLLTAVDRMVDTLIGGALALLIYALWPTWEQVHVSHNIAERMRTLRDFGAAILQAYVNPGSYDEFALYTLLLKTRLALSNAEASVTRSLQEPAQHQFDADLGQGLLESSRAIMRSLLAIESYLLDRPNHKGLPHISTFCTHFCMAMSDIAVAIGGHGIAKELPNFQKDLRSLDCLAKNQVYSSEFPMLDALVVEAKAIVRHIIYMHQLLIARREHDKIVPHLARESVS
ncbi:hypothetical protein KSX_49520 [Ktedonospora formicarum]|uniref:Integral membrane bound transporter domain-containing protein n=2 Tax=Ktedonospora formicarum TaxID=2778364 RepID=A0A8J3I7E7_9CHLR|nr:hypothetical protein KSX_49520 [Ktedonospora formicarum]